MSTIVVGIDGSERDADAVALARTLSATTGAGLQLVGVFRAPPAPWLEGDLIARILAEEEATTLECAHALAAEGGGVEARAVKALSPARGLHEAAEDAGAIAVVVGQTHRGRLRRVAGVPERLLHGASCAIAIAPHGYGTRDVAPVRRIVVAFDGHEESAGALRHALALASVAGASVRVLGVVEPPSLAWAVPHADPVRQDVVARTRTALRQAIEEIAAESIAAVEIALPESHLTDTLVEASGEDADLLVCGTRGNGPLAAVLLGSVSNLLEHATACPLLAVPRGAPELVTGGSGPARS